MFYNSRKRVYNMGVKSERNLNSSRADDLNQLIIFPPYHIVNPETQVSGIYFSSFLSLLWLFCASPNFSLNLRFYCGFSVRLISFSAPLNLRFCCGSSVRLIDFSVPTLVFLRKIRFFLPTLALLRFFPFSHCLFLADLIFYAAFSGNPSALVRRHAQKLGKRKNAPPPLAGAHCSDSLLFPLIRHKLL